MRSSCSSVVGRGLETPKSQRTSSMYVDGDGRYRRSYQGPLDTDAMTTGDGKTFLCAYHSGRDLTRYSESNKRYRYEMRACINESVGGQPISRLIEAEPQLLVPAVSV